PENLLLVGPTSRRRTAAALLGTTAQRVLQASGSPVVVLRSELPAQPRVLFAVDLGSPDAAAVITRASAIIGQLRRSRPVQARLVTVVKLELDLGLALPDLKKNVIESASRGLDDFVRDLPGSGDVERCVRMGSPTREIVEEANE